MVRTRESEAARLRKWRATHPEHASRIRRQWIQKNPEYYKIWNKNNPEKYKATKWKHHLKSTYGITPELEKFIRIMCDNKCVLCGYANKTVIDHDHQTGEIRGLLCSLCNTALGTLGDTVEGLERAIAYLRGGLP